jgi:hypothetical protein
MALENDYYDDGGDDGGGDDDNNNSVLLWMSFLTVVQPSTAKMKLPS